MWFRKTDIFDTSARLPFDKKTNGEFVRGTKTVLMIQIRGIARQCFTNADLPSLQRMPKEDLEMLYLVLEALLDVDSPFHPKEPT